MSNDPLLGGSRAPVQAPGKDIDALGPSDSSDSGSDVQTDLHRSALPDDGSEGAAPIAHGSSSDAAGTGERASADPVSPQDDADVLPDRIGTVSGARTDDDEMDVAFAEIVADDDDEEGDVER